MKNIAKVSLVCVALGLPVAGYAACSYTSIERCMKCSSGYGVYDGACQQLCGDGYKQLVANGKYFNVFKSAYGNKQLVVQKSGSSTKCYIPLTSTSSAVNGAMNLDYSGSKYYALPVSSSDGTVGQTDACYNQSATSCSYSQQTVFSADWKSTCSTGVSVTVKGVAYCSSSSATLNSTATSVTGGGATKRYCWCRVVSPGLSKWVYAIDEGDAISCGNNCADDCASKLNSTAAFRSAILSGLSN